MAASPATDGGARRVLGRDTDPTARPGVAEGGGGRQEQIVDDGLVRPRGQDLVETASVSTAEADAAEATNHHESNPIPRTG